MKRSLAIVALAGLCGCEAPAPNDREFSGIWSCRFNDSQFQPTAVDPEAAAFIEADKTSNGLYKPWWLIAEETSPLYVQYFSYCRSLPNRLRFASDGVKVFIRFKGLISERGTFGPSRKYGRMVYPRQLVEFTLLPGADGDTPDVPCFQGGMLRFFSPPPA